MNSRRLMGFTPVAENHLRVSLIRSSSESYAPRCSKTGGCRLWVISRHDGTNLRCPLYPESGHLLAHASHGCHRIGIMTAGDVIFSGIFSARTGVIPVCYFLDFY